MDLEAAPKSSIEPAPTAPLPTPRAALQSALDSTKTPAPSSREEVVTLRRPAAAPRGDQPAAERPAGVLEAAARIREAAYRASRTPAVEIIARLSQERTRLKNELAAANDSRAQAIRERDDEARVRAGHDQTILELEAALEAAARARDEIASSASAEVERLRARVEELVVRLEAPAPAEPDSSAEHEALAASLRAQLDALREEVLAHDVERDELRRLRRHTAELEHAPPAPDLSAELEQARAANATLSAALEQALEANATFVPAFEQARAEREQARAELEQARAETARLSSEHGEVEAVLKAARVDAESQRDAALRSAARAQAERARLGEATLAVDATARRAAEDAPASSSSPLGGLRETPEEAPAAAASRPVRVVAFGFGSARDAEIVAPPPLAPVPASSGRARALRRYDDASAHAHPYPPLEPRTSRERARLEKALRRMDQRLGRFERARVASTRAREAELVAQLERAVASLERARKETLEQARPAAASPPAAAPAPRDQRATRPAPNMFASGGGVLAKLAQQNLAIQHGLAPRATRPPDSPGNNS